MMVPLFGRPAARSPLTATIFVLLAVLLGRASIRRTFGRSSRSNNYGYPQAHAPRIWPARWYTLSRSWRSECRAVLCPAAIFAPLELADLLVDTSRGLLACTPVDLCLANRAAFGHGARG